MNIKNIILNHNYKYTQLTTILEIPFKKCGNSRNSQLKELGRLCEFHKEGHSIIITKIKLIPDLIDDKRGDPLSKNLMMKLILDLLSCSKKPGGLIISKNKLCHSIGVINDNYMYYRHSTKKISNYLEVDDDIIKDTVHSIDVSIKSKCDTALKGLTKSGFIFAKNIIAIKDKDSFIHREALDYEYDLIVNSETEFLKSCGIEHKGVVYLLGERKVSEMRDYVHARLLEEDIDIDFYYYAYKISGTLNSIEYGKVIMDKRVVKEIKSALKKHLKLNENHKAFLRQLSSTNKMMLNDPELKEIDISRIDGDYVLHSEKAIDHFFDENENTKYDSS